MKSQQFIADLHIHSRFSQATSKSLTLEELDRVAMQKGIQVLGTGDFVHPKWLMELKKELVEKEQGLYVRKSNKTKHPTRFMLTVEISSIYSKNGRVYRIHTLVFAPSLKVAESISKKLDTIGNIHSDGRPIFGIDVRDLAELVFEIDANAMVVPAHIWTPWFSVLGSKSGFDSIQDAFEDMSKYIFAVETGLSSDPPMNWRCSILDKYTLISNSDAHSSMKLGREANVFLCPLSYNGIHNTLRKKSGKVVQTIEFFPEEGRYFYDGHRKCNISQYPQHNEHAVCPVCKKKFTIGVLSRVEDLADREPEYVLENAPPFTRLVPLQEIVATAHNKGVLTKTVQSRYNALLEKLGTEMDIVLNATKQQIIEADEPLVAEGLEKCRKEQVHITPGFDGEYGKIVLFPHNISTPTSATQQIFTNIA